MKIQSQTGPEPIRQKLSGAEQLFNQKVQDIQSRDNCDFQTAWRKAKTEYTNEWAAYRKLTLPDALGPQ